MLNTWDNDITEKNVMGEKSFYIHTNSMFAMQSVKIYSILLSVKRHFSTMSILFALLNCHKGYTE